MGPGRSYQVVIGSQNLPRLGFQLNTWGNSVFVITNHKINSLYGQQLIDSLKSAGITSENILVSCVPDTEQSKSVECWLRLIQELYEFDATIKRRIVLVNLGGGVVGDLGGFVAATYRRGIPYVQVPTTLLSNVDSALGGKVGLDHNEAKNIIGAFYQPRLIWVDLSLLRTLDSRQLSSGLSEVIKYGVICSPALFGFVEQHLADIFSCNEQVLHHIVQESYQIKARLVEIDEFDQKGHRIILNFGHTIGHALEAAAGYEGYTHGEAVAVGMICAAEIASRMGIFPQEDVQRLEQLLVRANLPVRARGVSVEQIMQSLAHDKKFVGGRNRFVLPTAIGQVVVKEGVDEELIRKVVGERIG